MRLAHQSYLWFHTIVGGFVCQGSHLFTSSSLRMVFSGLLSMVNECLIHEGTISCYFYLKSSLQAIKNIGKNVVKPVYMGAIIVAWDKIIEFFHHIELY